MTFSEVNGRKNQSGKRNNLALLLLLIIFSSIANTSHAKTSLRIQKQRQEQQDTDNVSSSSDTEAEDDDNDDYVNNINDDRHIQNAAEKNKQDISNQPIPTPSVSPSSSQSEIPSASPTTYPTLIPSQSPSVQLSVIPTNMPFVISIPLSTSAQSVSPSSLPSNDNQFNEFNQATIQNITPGASDNNTNGVYYSLSGGVALFVLSSMMLMFVHKKKTLPEDIDDTHHATNVSASKSGHMSIVDESSQVTVEMK
eukprot:CAMPEP_0194419370 /NCGR_PEP_ID=MMETSP0176-20130528/18534_1 /TAXON_ID=216777 /ORGANISM="Proboscia alata, Strain PI-D3" /LENGTH=252 /DNA_ID=CAMNT_0039226307 /DNA_START=102 /DNA_END=860 /DNA_ORIENTATION=-